jgi:hypothetical protein
MPNMNIALLRLSVLAFTLVLALAGQSRAGFVITVYESGDNVVAMGSGTLNTTSLGISTGFYAGALVQPYACQLEVGGSLPLATVESGGSISGPSTLGPGQEAFGASSTTGSIVGVADKGQLLVLPYGYVSGTFLSSSSTWDNQTIESLGLDPGTYTWTWGSGASSDPLTMNIAGGSVPEPPSLILLLISAIFVISWKTRCQFNFSLRG